MIFREREVFVDVIGWLEISIFVLLSGREHAPPDVDFLLLFKQGGVDVVQKDGWPARVAECDCVLCVKVLVTTAVCVRCAG